MEISTCHIDRPTTSDIVGVSYSSSTGLIVTQSNATDYYEVSGVPSITARPLAKTAASVGMKFVSPPISLEKKLFGVVSFDSDEKDSNTSEAQLISWEITDSTARITKNAIILPKKCYTVYMIPSPAQIVIIFEDGSFSVTELSKTTSTTPLKLFETRIKNPIFSRIFGRGPNDYQLCIGNEVGKVGFFPLVPPDAQKRHIFNFKVDSPPIISMNVDYAQKRLFTLTSSGVLSCYQFVTSTKFISKLFATKLATEIEIQPKKTSIQPKGNFVVVTGYKENALYHVFIDTRFGSIFHKYQIADLAFLPKFVQSRFISLPRNKSLIIAAFTEQNLFITSVSFATKKLVDFVHPTERFEAPQKRSLADMISAKVVTESIQFSGKMQLQESKITKGKTSPIQKNEFEDFCTGILSTTHTKLRPKTESECAAKTLSEKIKKMSAEELNAEVTAFLSENKAKHGVFPAAADVLFGRFGEFSASDIWESAEKLMKTTEISFVQTKGLVDKLMQENMISALLVFIKRINQISEKTIVRLVRYFVNLDSDNVLNYRKICGRGAGRDTASEVLYEKRRFIFDVSKLPFSKVLLKPFLKEMSINEVIELLNIILAALKKFRTSAVGINSLLLWVNTLLDTFCTQLLMASDASAVLQALSSWAKAELGLVENLAQLVPYFEAISGAENAASVKVQLESDRKTNAVYCIKTLTFC